MCRTCGSSDSGPLRVERGALADAEAVLLVHHRDRERAELDRLLDQGVGADHDRGLAARRGAPAARRGGAWGSPRSAARRAPARPPAASPGCGSAARPGSRSAPSARPGARPRARAASRRGRTTVLPAAHLAHQQPLHRLGPGEVRVDVVERRALVAGQLERQRVEPAPHPLARGADLGPAAALGAATAPRPPARPGRAAAPRRRGGARASAACPSSAGKCEATSASATPGIPSARAPARGNGSSAFEASGAACQAHSRSFCGRSRSEAGWTGTSPVVWIPAGTGPGSPRPPPRFASASGALVLGDGEAALLELAPQQQPRPGRQLVREPGAVEPGRGHARRSRRRPPPRGCVSRRRRVGRTLPALVDLDLDRRLLPQLQLAEPDRRGPVAVGVRQVAEQVAEARDPDLGRGLGQLRARPPELGQRSVEDPRPRRANRRGQQGLPVQRLPAPDRPGNEARRGLGHRLQCGLHRHKSRPAGRCIGFPTLYRCPRNP